MTSLGFMDIVKLTYKAIGFKFEQNKLTTREYAVVETDKGPIRGVKRISVSGNPYFSFEKIPFAKPPLGELRFRAPEPAEPWTEVKDGTCAAEKPLQTNFIFKKFRGSEDCLYLNVFTRNCNPEKPFPVMVWIYGGGFQIGEATRDLYSPDYFMAKNVVVITVAYRLGPFGFLSFEDPTVNVPGNSGLKDQVLALKWVKKNCAKFGGDPNNVTIFGESAGGASTHIIMISEQTKGLINKAIAMSGTALCPWANPPKNNWAYRIASSLGYMGEYDDRKVFDFLKNAKGPDMVKAAATILQKDEKRHRLLFAFGPVVEPYITDQCIIPETPLSMMKKTWSNNIPLLIGAVSFEGLLFYPEIRRRPATLDEVGDCEHLLPLEFTNSTDLAKKREFGLALKKTYFGGSECSQSTLFEFLELLSYREFWDPIYRTIQSRLQHSSAPTYLYRFDYDSKEFNQIRNLICGKNVRGTCHGDELCYLFYNLFTHKVITDTPEYHIMATMVDMWTSFAAESNPNCEMLNDMKFEPLTKSTPSSPLRCLNISTEIKMMNLPETHKLSVWNSFHPKEEQ